jgi:predicted RNA binding protein YcfA (HicA-like mRNA interferase family)
LTKPNIIGRIQVPLSGQEMLKLYRKAGWVTVSKKRGGSHIKVKKGLLRTIIPMHKELKKGMEQALLKKLRQETE